METEAQSHSWEAAELSLKPRLPGRKLVTFHVLELLQGALEAKRWNTGWRRESLGSLRDAKKKEWRPKGLGRAFA